MDEDDVKKLELIVYLIVLVVFLGAVFNIPSSLTNLAVQWLVGAFLGSVISLVAGALRHGNRQSLETLINEESLLFAKYLRNEKETWIP
ncbi:hypothetical protein COS86_03475 [Candidatus Bathyarchaeota archaeon CG07_land_8_20_14_0_80_47_9]|jgi:L-cystine uptake protein TcyP (sodium:dicarboxylate symporter family)|nr:MAG: hypothetical protein COS86_03475 [Candidatus Bathyarchaeota archaeon CG07_land_8_20_14_0_80_47_9]